MNENRVTKTKRVSQMIWHLEEEIRDNAELNEPVTEAELR